MDHGLGLWLGHQSSYAAGAAGVYIAPPVLTWTTASNNATPGFDVDLTLPEVDDVITLEWDNNSDFSSPIGSDTNTVEAGELAPPLVNFVVGALADGTYYFRAKHARGGSVSAWSTSETVTIDATAPTITSSNAINQAENAAFSHTLTANETVTWTKTGGADTALFTLAGSNLSMTAKDYESPVDADTNNTYVVQVTATDAAGNATNQTITVTVTDVAEGGSLFLLVNGTDNLLLVNGTDQLLLAA